MTSQSEIRPQTHLVASALAMEKFHARTKRNRLVLQVPKARKQSSRATMLKKRAFKNRLNHDQGHSRRWHGLSKAEKRDVLVAVMSEGGSDFEMAKEKAAELLKRDAKVDVLNVFGTEEV